MIKKYTLIAVALSLASIMSVSAQHEETPQIPTYGQIALIPYLPEHYPAQAEALLSNKLTQIATEKGLAGAGFDDRFIITAHIQTLNKETTATIPQKTAVRLSVTLYIGDGIEGTLFSQYEMELRGIGSNEQQAWLSALRRIQPRDTNVQAFVEKGRQHIVSYYDRMAPTIITKAKTLAKTTQYDKAITMLLTIPSACTAYGDAQQLISEYGRPAIENANNTLLAKATVAWSAQPNESGASSARSYLSQISYPNRSTESAMQELTRQMATTLSRQYDQEWQLLTQERQNWHERQMEHIKGYNAQQVALIESEGRARVASIIAAAEVEKAWINRPRVVYHVNWW